MNHSSTENSPSSTPAEASWKQYFPTYSLENPEVALEEYKAAAKTLEAEERVFLNASNMSIVAAAGLGSLAVGSVRRLAKSFSSVLSPELTYGVILAVTIGYAITTLRYFADRQKSVVFASRKVIVLRRMLGLSYGRLQLVLPNWRVEGADEPLVIRLFPGWNTYVAYPLLMIGGIASVVVLFVSLALLQTLLAGDWTLYISPSLLAFGAAIGAMLFLARVYRKALLDTHERMLLLYTLLIARVLRITILRNVEYVVYRASLAGYELHRLQIELGTMKRLLLFVEDRTFHTHPGVSLRGFGRALLAVVGLRKRSGGSTITQQLVRTLFIQQTRSVLRRKAIELLLALWFDRVIEKKAQLDMYLGAVRFERGVYGVAAAMRHFFGDIQRSPTVAQSLFLVERVSNVNSLILANKIAATFHAVRSDGLCSEREANELVLLYEEAVRRGTVRDDGNLIRLKDRLSELGYPIAA